MLPALLALIAGSLVGVILSVLFQETLERAWLLTRARFSRLFSRRVLRRYDEETASARLVSFYQERFPGVLYRTVHVSGGLNVPLLFDDATSPFGLIEPIGGQYAVLQTGTAVDLAVKKSVIRSLKRSGARLWDGQILCLSGPSEPPSSAAPVKLQPCSYYSYLTRRDQLMRELAGRRKPELERAFRSVPAAFKSGARPIAVSVTCALVFETGTAPLVAVQRRSNEVIKHPGQLSLLPMFGLESNRIGNFSSSYNLLFYNFVKEYLEELHDYPDLIDATAVQRGDPDWFFELPEAKSLMSAIDVGSLEFRCLGIACDPKDGRVMFGLMAHFRDQTSARQVVRSTKANWESADRTPDDASLEFLEVEDPTLDGAARTGYLEPSSVFTLDLVRQTIRAPQDQS